MTKRCTTNKLQDSHIQFLEQQREIEEKKKELRAAKTLQDYIQIGVKRGYKSGWAFRKFNERLAYQSQRQNSGRAYA